MSLAEQRQFSSQYADLVNEVLVATEAAGRSVVLAHERLELVQAVSEQLDGVNGSGVTVDPDIVATHERLLGQAEHDDRILAAVARPLLESIAQGAEPTTLREPEAKPIQSSKPNKIRPGWMVDSTAVFWQQATHAAKLYKFGFEVGTEKYINIIAAYRLRMTTPMIRLLLGIGQGSEELFKSDVLGEDRLNYAHATVNAGASAEEMLPKHELDALVNQAIRAGYLAKTERSIELTPAGLEEISDVNIF